MVRGSGYKGRILVEEFKREMSGLIRKKLVRCGSHRGESPQNGLRDERTCGTTLASAYMLRRLSAAWSQLQMMEKSPGWK